jgi:hypothetical protein
MALLFEKHCFFVDQNPKQGQKVRGAMETRHVKEFKTVSAA